MSSVEADYWRKYLLKNGLLADQIELSAALVCSTVANFAGKVSKKDFNVTDFMPSQVEKDNTRTPEAQASLAQKLRMAFALQARKLKNKPPALKPT